MYNRSFYRFTEACKKIEISKATYLRYVEQGVFKDVKRDARNWRIFYDDDIERIRHTLKQVGLLISDK